jgi:hypothetical protein
MTARADRPRSPDLAVGVGLVAVGYLLGGLGPCLILLARDLEVPRRELGWLAAGFGVSLLLFGVFGSWLLRAGADRVLRACAAALALGLILLAAAPALLVAQAGALLIGVGAAGIVLANPALLTGPTMAARLTRVNAAASIAAVSAPLFISALDALSESGRMALLLPLPGLVWLAATAFPSVEPTTTKTESEATTAGFVRPAFGWLCVVLAVSAEFAFLVWGAARLQDAGLRESAAAAAAVAFPVGMATGRLAASKLLAAIPVVPAGMALAMAAAATVAAPLGPVAVTVALAAAGLGLAPLYPVMLARLVSTPGLAARRGAALGSAASGTAALSSPILLEALAGPASLRGGFLFVIPLLLGLLALQRASARWSERAVRG